MNPEEYAQLFRLGEKHWWFIGTRDILFSCISHHSLKCEAILDVGCGSGLMMKRFSESGTVFGVDNNAGALQHCCSIGYSKVCQGNAETLPFKSNAFGLIISTDMLEHCDNDEAVLRELYRVAASEGILLLSVPAYNFLWSAHDVALHHKRRYSKREFVQKVEAVGFTVNRASFFNTLLFPPVALKRLTFERLRQYPSTYRIRYHEGFRLLNQILLTALRMEEWLLKRGNLPFGLSILLLASKNESERIRKKI